MREKPVPAQARLPFMRVSASEGVKEKGRLRGAALKCESRFKADYIPEPWIFFQLASIAFTALSGSGTY